MKRFVPSSMNTLRTMPDMMPICGVLLALVAVFAFPLVPMKAQARYDKDISFGGCGRHSDDRVLALVSVKMLPTGDFLMNNMQMDQSRLIRQLRDIHDSPDWLLVDLKIDDNVDYGQAVAFFASLQNAGVPAHHVAEFTW